LRLLSPFHHAIRVTVVMFPNQAAFTWGDLGTPGRAAEQRGVRREEFRDGQDAEQFLKIQPLA
jgi:hypothetical protein